MEDYHSNNARRLNLEQMKDLLLTLPEMRKAMARRGLPIKAEDRVRRTEGRNQRRAEVSQISKQAIAAK